MQATGMAYQVFEYVPVEIPTREEIEKAKLEGKDLIAEFACTLNRLSAQGQMINVLMFPGFLLAGRHVEIRPIQEPSVLPARMVPMNRV